MFKQNFHNKRQTMKSAVFSFNMLQTVFDLKKSPLLTVCSRKKNKQLLIRQQTDISISTIKKNRSDDLLYKIIQ